MSNTGPTKNREERKLTSRQISYQFGPIDYTLTGKEIELTSSYYVFTFLYPCCAVRYDLSINTMFS
jgi:hypothetical protein